MKATIKTYRNNATLFVNDNAHTIDWDGCDFDTVEEYDEWITEQLTPAAATDNYDDIKHFLEIATDYLRPSQPKKYYWVTRAWWNHDETDTTATEDSDIYDNREEALLEYVAAKEEVREDINFGEIIEVTLFSAESEEEEPAIDDLVDNREEEEGEFIRYNYASVDGALLVCWHWDRYIGYARELREIRYGYYGETEEMCIETEKVFRPQWSVLATAEELEGLTDEQKRELAEERLNESHWKWNMRSNIAAALDNVFPQEEEED